MDAQTRRWTRPVAAIAAVTAAWSGVVATTQTRSGTATVVAQRVPDGGIQPQVAVDERGTVHLIYFRGNPSHGDVFYVHSTDGGTTFSQPIQVNHQDGSAIATGSVRGAQLAVGRNGRVHVAWNGSDLARPKVPAGTGPLLYTRLDDSGAFEPERNIIHQAYGVDGGSTVAADRNGHVYIVWHAPQPGEKGEEHRRVWIARSSDDGKTFEEERAISEPSTGSCGCCAAAAFADSRANLFVLYRSAFETVHRDMHLLTSRDRGGHFAHALVDRWNAGACVMSTEAFAESQSGVLTAWETEGQVYFGQIDSSTGEVSRVIGAPGEDRRRKHPALAADRDGHVLFAWTEGTAWSKGGSARWQLFDRALASGGPAGGVESAVPVWGLVAAYARPGGGFGVMY
jgi:hypothetical protein